jgi:hypothetical protein
MTFRASFCDPFQPKVIELGIIEKDNILEHFESIPWLELLEKMDAAKEKDIHYSPSLEIENKENKHGVTVSAVDGTVWYIFFKRPKKVKRFFGLSEKIDPHYTTESTGQTIEDARACLQALVANDLMFLEEKIK